MRQSTPKYETASGATTFTSRWPTMRRATIAYRDSEIEAREQDDLWTVRLAHLETRARYLDLALAELLGDAPEAHRAAAKLLTELADVVQRQEAAQPRPAAARPPQKQIDRHPQQTAKPIRVALHALAFALVSSTAFMLTTWLSTLR